MAGCQRWVPPYNFCSYYDSAADFRLDGFAAACKGRICSNPPSATGVAAAEDWRAWWQSSIGCRPLGWNAWSVLAAFQTEERLALDRRSMGTARLLEPMPNAWSHDMAAAAGGGSNGKQIHVFNGRSCLSGIFSEICQSQSCSHPLNWERASARLRQAHRGGNSSFCCWLWADPLPATQRPA